MDYKIKAECDAGRIIITLRDDHRRLLYKYDTGKPLLRVHPLDSPLTDKGSPDQLENVAHEIGNLINTLNNIQYELNCIANPKRYNP